MPVRSSGSGGLTRPADARTSSDCIGTGWFWYQGTPSQLAQVDAIFSLILFAGVAGLRFAASSVSTSEAAFEREKGRWLCI